MRVFSLVATIVALSPITTCVMACISHQQEDLLETDVCAPTSDMDDSDAAGATTVEDAGATGEDGAWLDVEEKLGEAAQGLIKVIRCRGLTVEECSKKCRRADVKRVAHLPHPKKNNAGTGDLFTCSTIRNSCTYYYKKTGDRCVFWTREHRRPMCVYVGGRP